jgi:hypothetical protein
MVERESTPSPTRSFGGEDPNHNKRPPSSFTTQLPASTYKNPTRNTNGHTVDTDEGFRNYDGHSSKLYCVDFLLLSIYQLNRTNKVYIRLA